MSISNSNNKVLPPDIWVQTVKLLPCRALHSVSQVNKECREIVHTHISRMSFDDIFRLLPLIRRPYPLQDQLLSYCAEHNVVPVLQRLLQVGRDFNERFTKNNGLNEGEYGTPECGSRPGIQNALQFAASRGHKAALAVLLNARPDRTLDRRILELLTQQLRNHNRARHEQPILVDLWHYRNAHPDLPGTIALLQREILRRYGPADAAAAAAPAPEPAADQMVAPEDVPQAALLADAAANRAAPPPPPLQVERRDLFVRQALTALAITLLAWSAEYCFRRD